MPTRDRIEKNERLFREVNERIREIGDRFADGVAKFDFFCECADFSCSERVTLQLDVYIEVRTNPARFLVLPGHELPETEVVVERHPDFVVVEKPWLDAGEG